MAIKKAAIRKGDKVRIVNSRFIRRVGYPLVFTDLRDEFADHPRFWEAMRLLGVIPEGGGTLPHYAKRDAVDGLAKAAVRARGWGGKERTIHYYKTCEPNAALDFTATGTDEMPDYTGCVTEVLDRRVRMTGTYYAPWSGQSYEGEYDYEPGGLSGMKAHVILSTDLGDIEARDVELIHAEVAA